MRTLRLIRAGLGRSSHAVPEQTRRSPLKPADVASAGVLLESGGLGQLRSDIRSATGALLIEQNDEWLVNRRYLSAESISHILDDQDDTEQKEVTELKAG